MPASHPVPVLRATIRNGKVAWSGIDGKKWETAKRFLEGAEVEITIQKRRKRATAKQRKYYWPVIVAMIAEAAGYGPDEYQAVHEALKLLFLRENDGEGPLPIARSTESLTTVEREQYHEHCRRFAAETWGIYIPLPNEISGST